ncbi:myosin-14-like [Vigna unguiculata]|uniref:myosin-14-like n=1 Tax=Vigna unguiculata TaxID=3917 RepID=UPI001016356E|nr:myosin-14-like [Vigna unguiculata]
MEKIYGIVRENFRTNLTLLLSSCIKVDLRIGNAMFSSILLQGECCTFKDGEYVKSGLAELEGWCTEATKEYISSSLDEFKHATQGVKFLVAE